MRTSVRLALPITEWPEHIRAAWLRATSSPTSLFAAGTAAAKLSPATVRARADALENWFGFLNHQGMLDPCRGDVLVTAELLDRYVAEQRNRGNRNSTIAHRLEGLHGALRLITPDRDFSLILRPGGRSLSRALPFVPRAVTIESPQDLLDLALALFQKGLAGQSYSGGKMAIRDAALIGILATRAPRNGALSQVELGQQLYERDGTYWLSFREKDMKGDQPLGYPLPTALTPVLNTYFQHVRSELGGNHTTRVWVGARNQPVSAAALAKAVRRRTRECFGTAHSPHWFRKCLTTTAALEAPEMVLDVCTMLGHSPSVSLRHYNEAIGAAAAQRQDARISRLQKETRLLARRAFRTRHIGSGPSN
jgi:hypothetical protein